MSAFTTTTPPFQAFLERAKDDPSLAPGVGGILHNTCFIAQNFLIEERLDPSRAASYAAALPPALRTFAEWDRVHKHYLETHVFLRPTSLHDYRVVDRDDPAVCPETFRAPLALGTFQGTDLDTAFIRLVSVSDIASMSMESEYHVFSLGQQAMADPGAHNPAWQELSLILETAFTGPLCQHRPVFASFYEDFLDELSDPTDINWPNRLRDQMGLYHINQLLPAGLPQNVFLFKYPVRDIPRHTGANEAGRRPIAVPSVIDHRLFEAFCPAPKELDRGRLLNLEAGSRKEPAREVLHLFMPLRTEHLFRVGQVSTPVPDKLAPFREDHLIWLRLLSGRDEYGTV